MPVRVFIFEDNWMCREALVSVLGKERDIEIAGAADEVQEGLDACAEAKPDVVLMDVLFRGERLGISAASMLKGMLPEAKIIIFTEFPDEETLQSAVTGGASGFLLKTEVQDPATIVRAIMTVHRGDAFLTPSMTAQIFEVVQRLVNRDRYGLTKREREILMLIAEGKENRSIGKELRIDERTVANHVSNLLFKMNAKNRTEAASIARREGIVK